MLNDKEQFDLQGLLKKKQQFIQKAIAEIQKGNFEKAVFNVNIDAGFNIEINKILESKIKD